MPLRINPFHEIYLADSINPDSFLKLFSPLLISDTLPLFQVGNVILQGTQGSGKSMLLALLKPEIRVVYAKEGKPFPVPNELGHFLSGGINLIRSGVIDFGQRNVALDSDNSSQTIPLYFADFVNIWIILDILRNIELLARELNGKIAKEMGLKVERRKLDEFALRLSENRCWSGYLDKVTDYSCFKKALDRRIKAYYEFLRFNIDQIPPEISSSKTGAGEPISRTTLALWESGIVPKDIPFFVRIDQCEEMVRLEAKAWEQGLHQDFLSVINKMMGVRDPHVSYRLGGRKYTFQDPHLARMHASTGTIEDFRNFQIVDLDEILTRHENRKTWLFPKFAADVFRRRLEAAGYESNAPKSDSINSVFGGNMLTVDEKIKLYVGAVRPEEALNLEPDWSSGVKECLIELARNDLLSAKLGEAWVRQQLKKSEPKLPSRGVLPWEGRAKIWWRKERTFMASLQIAAKRAQKMLWARGKDILDLSGGNILMFLSLCQHIWASWLRSLQRDTDWTQNRVPSIDDPYIQTEGIEEASDRWYDKIKEEQGGDARRRFISVLGNEFRNKLRTDKRMSYPGHNGFSLSLRELDSDPEVHQKLQDATAFGFLIERKHTPKDRSLGECKKWYLHPILAPHFQIPATHTKEPIYAKIRQVRGWLEIAYVLTPHTQSTINVKSSHQGFVDGSKGQ